MFLVKHKHQSNCTETHVVAFTVGEGHPSGSVYLFEDGKWGLASDFERAETWRDVTKECEVIDGMIHHHGKQMAWRDGYRARKVRVCQHGGFGDCETCDLWAMRIEKKEV